MAQGKPSAGEQGAKRPPKTSTRVQGSGRASPVEKDRGDKRAPRVPDDEMEGLFVDAAPDSKKSGRAADRRRERGQAPPPVAPPDTRTSLPQREQEPSQLSSMSEASPKAFVRAALVCTRGPEEGLSLNLIDGSYTIGRARENSFVLKDIAASRRHLRIDVDARGSRVTDLGSGNGTRVNGKRIGEHELRHGDRIEIGGSVLLFQEKGKAAPAKPDEPVDDAQERVIRAAEKLAAELSGRMRFGEESQAGYEDGHQAKTQAIPKETKEKLNEEIRKHKEREREKAAAAASPPAAPARIATPPPSGARSEKLWNETFTNLPLDKVVPADEPLRGPRAAESAPVPPPQVPVVQTRAPLPRPAPLPIPPPPEEMELSQSVSRGGSAFLYLVVTALAVVVIGGIVIGVYALTRNHAEDQVVADVEADFAQAMVKSQEAFKAGDWFRSYEYATAALQLRPGDPMATTYQRDARDRIDAAARAPAPVETAPAPVETAPAPAPVEATPTPAPPAPAPAPTPIAAAPAAAPAPPPAPVPVVVAPPEDKQVVEKPKPAPPPREASPPPPPRPKPAPAPRRTTKGMTDETAQAKFEDAVNALRDKDTKKGCRLLEEIADKAPGDSRWKEKAESLFSRRCD